MTAARTIASRITRHLAVSAGFAFLILSLTVTGYAFILRDVRERAELAYVRSFVTSQAPTVTRDLIARNIAATKILAEFVMLKERDRDLRLRIVSSQDGTVYEDEAFTASAAAAAGRIVFQSDLSYFGTTYGTLTAAVPGVTLWQVVRDGNLLLVLLGAFGLFVILLLVLTWNLRREIHHPLARILALLESAHATAAASSGAEPAYTALEWQQLYCAIESYRADALKTQQVQAELARQQAVSELAAQVAHDIRSPLAALEALARGVSQLPEERSLMIHCAVERVRDIASNLLSVNRRGASAIPNGTPAVAPPAMPSPYAVPQLAQFIATLVTEKRMQYRHRAGVEIREALTGVNQGLCATTEPVDFKRVLSNLIDNAVEASGERGLVVIGLEVIDDEVRVTVRDDGRGIPAALLVRLGGRGVTHGKQGGSGLGLYHAKARVEAWGGALRLASQLDVGTLVTIALPRLTLPAPAAARPTAAPIAVLLDDDLWVRESWANAASRRGAALRTVASRDELLAVLAGLPADTPIFLDSDLGDGTRGEDLARELRDRGFRALYMATGFEPERFRDLPWILDVIGKEPPEWLFARVPAGPRLSPRLVARFRS